MRRGPLCVHSSGDISRRLFNTWNPPRVLACTGTHPGCFADDHSPIFRPHIPTHTIITRVSELPMARSLCGLDLGPSSLPAACAEPQLILSSIDRNNMTARRRPTHDLCDLSPGKVRGYRCRSLTCARPPTPPSQRRSPPWQITDVPVR